MANSTLNPEDVSLTRKWASLYRMRGFNPLPSRTDDKRPMVRFREWWEASAPSDLFDNHETTNIQVMTGRHWRLLVIDLDGPEARERFKAMGQTPRTWATHSGGNGLHLWFTLPSGIATEIPKAFLWKGDEGHSAIERLCDRSLIMAPPSIHPKTGKRYRFASASESPARMPMPARCPAWILNAKALDMRPAFVPFTAPKPSARRTIVNASFDRREVLDAIAFKVDLARSWGLRVAGKAQPNGFVPCHAIGREDRNPSAGIHEATGTYVEPGAGIKLSFFDLAVALGQYHDFKEAIGDLGARHAV